MKLEKWALIAEVVGGVAVVGTLVLLVLETRENTDAIRAQTAAQAFSNSAQSFYYAEGNVALVRAQEGGLSSLDPDDRAHATALMASILTMYDSNYYQYRQGNLDEEIHQTYRRRLTSLMSVPFYQTTWPEIRLAYTESFQAYVDGILREID